ncbi:MAG: hypothetical protein AAGH99_01605 [Planctomycetota bacterium]
MSVLSSVLSTRSVIFRRLFSVVVLALVAEQAWAGSTVAATNFDDLAPGTATFTVGGPDFSATFSGGEVGNLASPPLYDTPPLVYLLSGAGAGGAGTVGLIEFSSPAASVSFNALNAANGQATIAVFGVDDALLTSVPVTADVAADLEADFAFTSEALGAAIGSITITNPGPATPPNPPYITVIDSFSATAVPTPSAAAAGMLLIAGLAARRRSGQAA